MLRKTVLAFVWLIVSQTLVHGQNARPHVVFIAGEDEYGSHWSLPMMADDLERRFNIKATVIHAWRSGVNDYDMPGKVEIPEYDKIENLEIIKTADLLVIHLRFLIPPPEQYTILQEYFDSGKPAIALRTTSHAFWPADRKGWFVPYFGGHYKGHMPNSEGTTTLVPAEQLKHPILRGVPKKNSMNDVAGIYFTGPLNESTVPLMLGKTGQEGPAQPVAWTNEYKKGQRIFYTSLGGLESYLDPGFINMVYNAVYWALGREVPEHGVLGMKDLTYYEKGTAFDPSALGVLNENPFDRPADELKIENSKVLDAEFKQGNIPAPPKAVIPKEAIVLFNGKDLSKWKHWDLSEEPVAMLPDARAVTPSPVFNEARWPVFENVVEARPGYGSLLSKEEFGNYRLHLDFLIPDEPDYVPAKYKGSGSIFLDGRYEIKILDSYGKVPGKFSNGSLFNQVAPSSNPSKPVNTWQSLDIEYRQYEGHRPAITVHLNGEQIHDKVIALSRSPFAIREEGNFFISNEVEGSGVYNLSQDNWSVEIRFRTYGEGYLFTNAPLNGPWDQNSKGIVIRDGRLVFRDGFNYRFMGPEAQSPLNDGLWHTMILSSTGGMINWTVDGKGFAPVANKAISKVKGHVLRLGQATRIFKLGASELPDPFDGELFDGEIERFRFYNKSLDQSEMTRVMSGEILQDKYIVKDWKPNAIGKNSKIMKGPIRIQSDLSKIRYANIWLQPLKD